MKTVKALCVLFISTVSNYGWCDNQPSPDSARARQMIAEPYTVNQMLAEIQTSEIQLLQVFNQALKEYRRCHA